MTLVYLDTSALAKLLLPEVETASLRRWLDSRASPTVVTSALTRVELTRAAARRSDAARHAVPALLDATSLVAVSGEILAAAAVIGPATLRPLDAIHLATAQQIGRSLTAFVAYDARLLAAAGDLGITTVSPR